MKNIESLAASQYRGSATIAYLTSATRSYAQLLNEPAATWPEIVSIEEPILPAFPTDGLPEWQRTFVRELAAATETPKELAAMMSLSVLAACVAKVYEVESKPGVVEPLNLFACVALGPGNRKTAVLDACRRPLVEWEQERAEVVKPEIARLVSQRESEKAIVASMRSSMVKSQSESDRAQLTREIAEKESKLTTVPHEPRLWASDTTPEKLGVLMAENNERFALLSDEGGIFDILAGLYNGGTPNLDLVLQGHSGAPVGVDRLNRERVTLKRPALTLGVCPQPSVIQGLAEKPGFRGRGFIARLLMALPKSFIGHRTGTNPPVTESARAAYRDALRSLLRRAYCGDDPFELVKTKLIVCDDQARQAFHEFSQAVEAEMAEGGKLDGIQDWAGKLPGAMMRIAGLLHVGNHIHSDPAGKPITLETLLSAREIAECLKEHALAAYGFMGADPEIEDAKTVLRWIRRKGLRQFTQREAHHALKSRFKKVKPLEAAFEILAERNYVLEESPRPRVAHRPSRTFRVSPRVFEADTVHGRSG